MYFELDIYNVIIIYQVQHTVHTKHTTTVRCIIMAEVSASDERSKKIVLYENYWIPPFAKEQIDVVKNFNLHPEDVFVASVPKAGKYAYLNCKIAIS